MSECSPWVYANANAKGFFRSSYSPEAVDAISKTAESALTPAERLLLLSDVWASVAVNREPVGDYLVLAEGLRKESNSAVLERVVQAGSATFTTIWSRMPIVNSYRNVGAATGSPRWPRKWAGSRSRENRKSRPSCEQS